METQTHALTEIRDEAGYLRAREILTTKQGFGRGALRSLMRTFEAYRASRKMGWSRPWNKYGLVTFRTLEFTPSRDPRYAVLAMRLARRAGCSPAQLDALIALADDPGARGFVFLHDRPEGAARFEGFTLSFGRVSALSRRHRDRFDVVVERVWPEDEPLRGAGGVLVRAYDDPYDGSAAFPAPSTAALALDDDTLGDVAEGLALARMLARDPARHWTHWTQDYIDAFGARAVSPSGSWFAFEGGTETP